MIYLLCTESRNGRLSRIPEQEACAQSDDLGSECTALVFLRQRGRAESLHTSSLILADDQVRTWLCWLHSRVDRYDIGGHIRKVLNTV